jgi:hypothetical protein
MAAYIYAAVSIHIYPEMELTENGNFRLFAAKQNKSLFFLVGKQ